MKYTTDISKEFDTDERCSIIEILNNSDLAHISIAQARLKPGITTELHSLDGDEFYYILQGKGTAELDREQKFDLSKGDVLHIKKDQPQRIKNTGTEELVFLCICTPRFEVNNYTSLPEDTLEDI